MGAELPRGPHDCPEPFDQLLDFMAGQSATAITLVNDPKSNLEETGHALIETAKDIPPLLAAARKVLEVAAEFDAEDGHAPQVSGFLRPASRGDRIRRAFLVGLVGEDGIATVIPESS
jgi:hypothetical protein